MRDIKEVVAGVERLLALYRRGRVSWEEVCASFETEWEENLFIALHNVREIEGGR